MNTPATTNNNELANSESITDISSMLLPLQGAKLLLPGVTVAEIVTFISPETDYDEEVPPWHLGYIYWRNQKLSLVSFEAMQTGEQPVMSTHCRVAVLNNAGQSHQLEFFAVLLQGTPRLLRLSQGDVVEDTEKELIEGEKMHVRVAEEDAVVPDISYMEKKIIDYLELS